MQVKIMRGISGSGKSFHSKRMFPAADFVSTDAYFYNEAGRYIFDPAKLAGYHDATLREYMELLREGAPLIVVDNTNIRVWELAPYYRLAEVYGYGVEIIHVLADVENCIKHNTHGVPEAAIRGMANGVEPIPPFWNMRTVINV